MYPRDIVIYTFTLLSVYILRGVGSIQITALRVPPEVRNGTGKPVVLDCEYSLRPEELSSNSGLVVKWFFNASPAPVYQWIVGQKPQDLDILRGRLKLDYKASSHVATMYRSLYIINPTTELSGEYKCAVYTFTDEDFMIKKMVVYATEKKMEIIQIKPDIQSVNLICRAHGIYPEPKMYLFYGADKTERCFVCVYAEEGNVKQPPKVVDQRMLIMRRIQIQDVEVVTTARTGEYDISASVSVQDDQLTDPTTFICELRIPHTTYVKMKTILYRPGSMDNVFRVSDGADDLRLSLIATATAVLLLTLVC